MRSERPIGGPAPGELERRGRELWDGRTTLPELPGYASMPERYDVVVARFSATRTWMRCSPTSRSLRPQ